MNKYDATLTRLNMAVNMFKEVRFELPHGKQERLVLEHAKKVRDAADEFIAAAEEKRHEHKKRYLLFDDMELYQKVLCDLAKQGLVFQPRQITQSGSQRRQRT